MPRIYKGRTEELERYLSETLHSHVEVQPYHASAKLPMFLERLYDFFELQIATRRCLVLMARESPTSPSEIARHVSLVRSAVDAVVIFAADSLAAHNRSRLIAQGVAFIVPGNQLYIPELAMDLREHFRSSMTRHVEGLSPAAQAVLFRHILWRDADAITPSSTAERLHYTKMSIGRAFDELVAANLAVTERHGKERHLKFNTGGRGLLELARPRLHTPVRATKYIERFPASEHWKRAGESALAELTDLARPRINTYAIPANKWNQDAKSFNLIEIGKGESDFAVETWSYDPAALSDTPTVDRLSLYVQFSNHPDERVAMAAETLLEQIPW